MDTTASEVAELAPVRDSILLTRFVRERDQDAFGQLVGRYESIVLGAGYRRTGNVEMARDVAQKVFMTLARRASSLVDHARLGGWLYRTASYEATRLAESERRRRKRETTFAASAEAATASRPDTWDTLETALSKMSTDKRDLIVMHYFQDQGYADMATDLGLSEVATRKRVSRALADLATRISPASKATSAATQLLAGAVAAQTVLAPTPSLASAVLASTTIKSATISSTLATMTSSTAIKAAAASALLVLIPIAVQWRASQRISGELKREQALHWSDSGGLPSMDHSLERSGQGDATETRRRLLGQVSEKRARLSELSTETATAQKELGEAKLLLEQINSEVVVSFGNPEELAARLVPIVNLIAKSLAMESDGIVDSTEAQEIEAESTKLVISALPDLQKLADLDSNPDAKARFVASLIVGAAGFDEELRQKIEPVLRAEMVKAKEAGLVFADQPERDSPERAAWDRRYDAATLAQVHSIEPLLPNEFTERPIWRAFSEGNEMNLSDVYAAVNRMFGDSRSLRAVPAPAPTPQPEAEPEAEQYQ